VLKKEKHDGLIRDAFAVWLEIQFQKGGCMARVVVVLADGFEEVEAMAIIDVLRRAEIDTVIAGLHEGPVTSARRVRVIADTIVDAIKPDDFDMIVLPGGQPGADNLNKDVRVKDLIQGFSRRGKMTGAICAAPIVLASAGVLEGRQATAFPTYKNKLGNAVYVEKPVVIDGTIITSRGPGTALAFGLTLVEKLAGVERAVTIRDAMLVTPF
jgi:protein deglycase